MRFHVASLCLAALTPATAAFGMSRSRLSTSMSLVGKPIPPVTLFEGQPEYSSAVEHSLPELCKGKKVVIFAVPGAFTPGCSKSHLPSFVEGHAELRASGVDLVICTATNDPYVMQAWGENQGVEDKVLMLSDKKAELCKALGVAKDDGVMTRSARYAMVVEDGTITHWLPAEKEDGSKWSENTYAPSVMSAIA